MRTTQILLLMTALTGTLAGPAAAASPYQHLFVFGDSLSDDGNAAALSLDLFPPSPYDHRFSNGPVAAEDLARLLGAPLAPSSAGGTDYAVGGATTGLQNYNWAANTPPGVNLLPGLENTGMISQVELLRDAGSQGAVDTSTSLFFLWGGGDDIYLAQAQGRDPEAAVTQAALNITNAILFLAQFEHASNFLVPNLPDLGQTPDALATLSPDQRAALTQYSMDFNARLSEHLAMLRALAPTLGASGIRLNLFEYDTFDLMHRVIADPAAYGFDNVSTPCLGNSLDCAGYLYFDAVHPSAAAHEVLADAFVSAVPEAPAPLLWLAGMAALALLLEKRRRGRDDVEPEPARA